MSRLSKTNVQSAMLLLGLVFACNSKTAQAAGDYLNFVPRWAATAVPAGFPPNINATVFPYKPALAGKLLYFISANSSLVAYKDLDVNDTNQTDTGTRGTLFWTSPVIPGLNTSFTALTPDPNNQAVYFVSPTDGKVYGYKAPNNKPFLVSTFICGATRSQQLLGVSPSNGLIFARCDAFLAAVNNATGALVLSLAGGKDLPAHHPIPIPTAEHVAYWTPNTSTLYIASTKSVAKGAKAPTPLILTTSGVISSVTTRFASSGQAILAVTTVNSTTITLYGLQSKQFKAPSLLSRITVPFKNSTTGAAAVQAAILPTPTIYKNYLYGVVVGQLPGFVAWQTTTAFNAFALNITNANKPTLQWTSSFDRSYDGIKEAAGQPFAQQPTVNSRFMYVTDTSICTYHVFRRDNGSEVMALYRQKSFSYFGMPKSTTRCSAASITPKEGIIPLFSGPSTATASMANYAMTVNSSLVPDSWLPANWTLGLGA